MFLCFIYSKRCLHDPVYYSVGRNTQVYIISTTEAIGIQLHLWGSHIWRLCWGSPNTSHDILPVDSSHTVTVMGKTFPCPETICLLQFGIQSLVVIITLVRQQIAWFDTKKPGSTQKCPVRHKMPSPAWINGHCHYQTPLPYRNYFLTLFTRFVFKNPYINQNKITAVKTVQQRTLVASQGFTMHPPRTS